VDFYHYNKFPHGGNKKLSFACLAHMTRDEFFAAMACYYQAGGCERLPIFEREFNANFVYPFLIKHQCGFDHFAKVHQFVTQFKRTWTYNLLDCLRISYGKTFKDQQDKYNNKTRTLERKLELQKVRSKSLIQDLQQKIKRLEMKKKKAQKRVRIQVKEYKELLDKAEELKETVRSLETKLQNTPKQDEEEDLCVICLDEDRTHAFIPCGHRVVCGDCRGIVDICPVCRVAISGSLRVFI